jgi:hypothetical protein
MHPARPDLKLLVEGTGNEFGIGERTGRPVPVAGGNPTTPAGSKSLANSQRGGKGAGSGRPRFAITSRIRSG